MGVSIESFYDQRDELYDFYGKGVMNLNVLLEVLHNVFGFPCRHCSLIKFSGVGLPINIRSVEYRERRWSPPLVQLAQRESICYGIALRFLEQGYEAI